MNSPCPVDVIEEPATVQAAVLQTPASASRYAGRLSGQFEKLLTGVEVLADVTAILFGCALAGALRVGQPIKGATAFSSPSFYLGTLLLVLLFTIRLHSMGAYRLGSSLLRVKETERVLRASVEAGLVLLAVTFIARPPFRPEFLLLAVLLSLCLLLAEKQALYILSRSLHSRGYCVRRAIIYGAGFTGKRIFAALVRSPKLGLNPVVFVDDDSDKWGRTLFEPGYTRRRGATVVAGPLTRDIIRNHDARVVILGIPSLSREKFLQAITEVNAAGATVSFVPLHVAPSNYWINHADVDGLLLASFDPPRPAGGYDLVKRCFDLVVALALVILLSPLLGVIALAIRMNSRGPTFFVQDRVGIGGRTFALYKFRTMCVDAPRYAPSPQTAEDPRITPVGRFLRRTSLDELPQLFNVVLGSMSLVGPRPEMPFIVEGYSGLQRRRLQVPPGITGMWQLSADRAFAIHENIEYDLYYIRNRSLFLDISILLHTVFFAARGV